jgi:hypothetical protein
MLTGQSDTTNYAIFKPNQFSDYFMKILKYFVSAFFATYSILAFAIEPLYITTSYADGGGFKWYLADGGLYPTLVTPKGNGLIQAVVRADGTGQYSGTMNIYIYEVDCRSFKVNIDSKGWQKVDPTTIRGTILKKMCTY